MKFFAVFFVSLLLCVAIADACSLPKCVKILDDEFTVGASRYTKLDVAANKAVLEDAAKFAIGRINAGAFSRQVSSLSLPLTFVAVDQAGNKVYYDETEWYIIVSVTGKDGKSYKIEVEVEDEPGYPLKLTEVDV